MVFYLFFVGICQQLKSSNRNINMDSLYNHCCNTFYNSLFDLQKSICFKYSNMVFTVKYTVVYSLRLVSVQQHMIFKKNGNVYSIKSK